MTKTIFYVVSGGFSGWVWNRPMPDQAVVVATRRVAMRALSHGTAEECRRALLDLPAPAGW